MNVLHINCNYVSTTLHQNLIRKLNPHININQVIVPICKNTPLVIVPDQNVSVIKCFNRRDRFLFYYKQAKIFKVVKGIVSQRNFNIIHAHTLFTDGNIARELKKKYGIPYLVAIRNTDVNVFFKYMIFLRKLGIEIMEDSDALIFLSESYKKLVFQQYIPDQIREKLEKKTYIIPNGIDDFWVNNRYKKKRQLSKEIKIIYAGRIDQNKNVTTTIEALKFLKEKGYNVQFLIVGKIIKCTILDEINSTPFVKYITNQPKEVLINLYRESDIFVMPSFHETFGLVYAEALSQGLPVVYTEGEGFDRQFEEGYIGFHVNSHDPQSIALAIEKIAVDYEAISSRCVEAASKFDWNAICKDYLSLYRKIIKTNMKG